MNDKPRLEPRPQPLPEYRNTPVLAPDLGYSVATIGGTSLSPSADELRAGGLTPVKTADDLPAIDHKPSENGQASTSAMIDLSRTRFIVTAWPDHRWSSEIWIWIEALMRNIQPAQHDYRVSVKKQNVVCARNWAIKNEALGSHPDYQWFVFIDKDVRPRKGMETARFLTINADVKSCQVYHGKGKSPYSWMDDFHEPIWCTTRRVLETIEPPWFMQKYNADGTEMDGCICQSFRAKVLEAKFSIAHGGWADHDRDGSWCG